MKLERNGRIAISLIMIGIILSFFGGSLAYWNWTTSESQKTNVSVKVEGASLTIVGGNVTHTGMYPTAYCDGEAALIGDVANVTALNGTASDMEVIIKIRASLSVSQGTLNADKKSKINWALVDTSAGTTCSNTTYKGTLANATTNTDIDTGIRFTATAEATTTKTYRIYVWLDSTYTHTNSGNVISDPMQNLNISVKFSPASELSQELESESSGPNAPILDSGMIPVTIANNGTVTTVSENDSSWYNYDNKQWANAVLVSSTSRSNYLGTTGKTITQSDILAYYVWIPRYKYKIWLKDGTTTSSPQEIDIVFENKNTVTTGSEVGDYMTHPAFIFGGENLSGIWVGKFETTGDATTPTILPNVSSLGTQNVSAQFATSLKFAGGTQSGSNVTFAGSNTYGLTTSTDSHMMKNSEWGAVAYLSHSRYGINSQIRINNNYYHTTGCGASEENGSSTSACQIAYGSGVASYPQSTTGNITGIFDMSGGNWEYVMGNYENESGWSGFNTFPENKYYDLYSSSQFTGDYSTNMTLCTLESCGGHALNETATWYGDYDDFVDSVYSWFMRGGVPYDVSSAGAFGAFGSDGGENSNYSWRSVLVVD